MNVPHCEWQCADLGLMRCVARNTTPSKRQRPPTTRYAMPRNGFLPPMTVRVEIRMDLVPLYFSTWKSRTLLACVLLGDGDGRRTVVDLEPVGRCAHDRVINASLC